MSAVVADTHAVVWFLLGLPDLSATARTTMDLAIRAGDPIYVATISLVELAYLIEKGRLSSTVFDCVDQVLDDPDSGFVPVLLDQGVSRTLRRVRRTLVPDMPDRIIAATALHRKLPLVTADRKIQASGIPTIW
jgi:PIN domain nuclease of toxin-antitoxin system